MIALKAFKLKKLTLNVFGNKCCISYIVSHQCFEHCFYVFSMNFMCYALNTLLYNTKGRGGLRNSKCGKCTVVLGFSSFPAFV